MKIFLSMTNQLKDIAQLECMKSVISSFGRLGSDSQGDERLGWLVPEEGMEEMEDEDKGEVDVKEDGEYR